MPPEEINPNMRFGEDITRLGREVEQSINSAMGVGYDPFDVVRQKFTGFVEEPGRRFREESGIPKFSDRIRSFREPNGTPQLNAGIISAGVSAIDQMRSSGGSSRLVDRMSGQLQRSAGIMSTGLNLKVGEFNSSYTPETYPSRSITTQLTIFERKSDPRQVESLVKAVENLRRTLGPTVITRVTVRYASVVENGMPREVPVGVSVGVRNFNENFIQSSLITRGVSPKLTEHTFNLTADRSGAVIDTDSNRYINGSAFSNVGLNGQLSRSQPLARGIETAVGLIATYARSSFFEAKHGVVDTAFNAMVARGDYSALGLVIGRLYQQRAYGVERSLGANFGDLVRSGLAGQEVKDSLRGLLKQIAATPDSVLASPEVSNQIDRVLTERGTNRKLLEAELYQKRIQTLERVFQPVFKQIELGGRFEDALQKSYKDLAFVMQQSTAEIKLSGGESLSLDLFKDLKLAALDASPFGRNYYTMLKGNASSSVLESLMAPFMQPHEASYSAGQLRARIGFYANPESVGPKSFYDYVYGTGIYYLTPQAYRHGSLGTVAGFAQKPIAATAAANRLGDRVKEVATFFENQVLFKTSPQLGLTSINKVYETLERERYRGAEELRDAIRQSLGFEESEESDRDVIFLMPFKKPEQMSQRLKNFTGTRPARELSKSFRAALESLDLDALHRFVRRDQYGFREFDYGKVLAGNINTALPAEQYSYAVGLKEDLMRQVAAEGYTGDTLLEEVSHRLTSQLRREDISPFATRGLIGGRNERRVLIAFGLNEMSDFYYANSAYDASYADLHLTRVKVKEIRKTFGDGGSIYEQNAEAETQKELLRRTFTVGSTLYYNPVDLGMESKTAGVLQRIFTQEARLAAANATTVSDDVGGSYYRLASQSVRNAFDFINKLDYSADGVLTRVELKPGLYSVNEEGVLYRSAELVDSMLRVGLKTEQEYPGGPMLQKYFGVKIPGEVRGQQSGIATVASDVNDRGEIGFLITSRDSAGIRPGVDFTKGPAAFIRPDLFNNFDERYGGRGYFARDVMQDQLFGLMSPSAFKGYNYESGLSVLRDPASRARLLNLSSSDTSVLLSLMFMGDGEGQRLRRAVQGYLGSTVVSDRSKKLLRLLEYNGGLGVSLNSFKNLVIGATPIVRLAGSVETDKGDKVSRPLYQIQQRLIGAFESRDAGAIGSFAEDVRYLLRSATEDTRSMEVLRRIDGERVAFRQFNESDPYVRAAAVLSDVLITMEQAVDYRGLNGKSMLSFNLMKNGRISATDFLNRSANERISILNMAYRSGINLPSDRAVEDLIRRMNRGERIEGSRDYQSLEVGLVNMYYQSQAAPLIQRSIKYLPSRLMVAAGSEDAVGLEYHYSLNMSSRALAELRGSGLEAEGLTEAQAAYSMVVSYGGALSFRRLKLDSAFKERQASRDIASVLRAYTPLMSSLRNFGAAGNRTMLEEITESLARGDRGKFEGLVQQADIIQRLVASSYEGEERFGVLRRTNNLVNYLDPSRLGEARTGRQRNTFDLVKGRYVLFDIETYDLINQGYDDGRRYPKYLAELAYTVVEGGRVVGKESFLIRPGAKVRPEDIPEKFRNLDLSQGVSSREALRHFFRVTAGADFLVGHNIGRFDLPTISTIAQRLGMQGADVEAFREKLAGGKYIDTLADIDKSRVRNIYRNESFSLSALFDAVEKRKAREEIRRLRSQGWMARAAELERKIAGEFSYDAHRALADVEANLSIFNDLVKHNLLSLDRHNTSALEQAARLYGINTSGKTTAEIRSELNAATPLQGRLTYFGYSEDASNVYRMRIAEQVLDIAKQSRGRSLIYTFESLRANGEFTGRTGDDIRAAINLVTDRGGFYNLQGNLSRQREQLLSRLVENDRRLEEKVKESLDRPAGQFIDVMKEQAGILERLVRFGDESVRPGAESLLREIKETRAYVFPTIETIEDKVTGRSFLRGYAGQEKVEFLGLDVLNAIPKEFKGHVSEIVDSQRALRMLEAEHRSIVQRVSRDGSFEASERELAVVREFNQLISRNREQMEELGGSVLKQRAYGEKIKYPGASFIALASPLLGIEEMTFSSRITDKEYASTPYLAKAEFGREARELEKVRRRISRLESRGMKFTVSDSRAGKFRDTTVYDEAFEKYIATQLGESEELAYYRRVNRTLRQTINKNQEVLDPARYARVKNEMMDDQYLSAAAQVETFVAGRLSSLRSKEAQLTRELGTIQKFDTIERGLSGMAMRAGAPHAGSSAVEQKAIGRTLESTVIERGEQEGTYLQISKEKNQTALFLSMFGRFGVQGGDFDGDAYQLVFGFKDLEKKYLTALEQRNSLSETYSRIQNELGQEGLDSDYRAYRQAELTELGGHLRDQSAVLQDIEQRLPERLRDLEDLRQRAMRGVRRHTAAYYGAPVELFSEEAGLFSHREILDMIEQPRGILGSMDNYSKNPALNNDAIVRMFHHLNQQTGFQQALQLSSGEDGLARLRSVVESTLSSGEFESIGRDDKQRVAAIVEQNLESFKGISSNSIIDTTSRLHKFTELAAEQSGFFSVVNEFSGMLTAAAGLSMGRTTFEAMQTVIGAQGTSLIGEAYNAITTLGPQALMSRAFAEMLNEGTAVRSIAVDSSGLEQFSPVGDFDQRFNQSLDMFADSPAKSLVQNIFAPESRSRLVKTAIGRAEDITGKLAVIQQVIRDSLKLKEAGGLLTAVRSVAGGESFEKRLESATDEAERYQLLRNFISQESGASLADLDRGGAFMSSSPRSSINMFGALLLLSDYVKADPSKGRAVFDEMVNGGQERYQVLRDRQRYYQAQLEGIGANDPQRSFVERMATDSEFLVRRTALDLMNAVVAEKQVDTMLQKRNAVEFTRRIREGYIGALAGFNGENYDALRQALGSSEGIASVYDITQEDIEQARSGGGFRDIFSPEELNRVADSEIAAGELEKYQFERARRIEYGANIARSRSIGMTEQDLLVMQRTLQGARAMRFDTAQTALDFKEFISADAANLEAFRMYSRREHLGSPDEFRLLQLKIASEYAGAIDQVTQRLERKYGSLSSAMQVDEVSRAYSSMVGMSGLFSQMGVGGRRLLDYGEETVRSVEEMVSLSMSRSGLFGEMANRFAGMKVMEETHQMYRRFLNEGGDPYSNEALGFTRDLEEFSQKQTADREALLRGEESRFTLNFLEEKGQQERARQVEEAFKIRDFESILEQKEQEKRSLSFSSALSIIAGPAAIAALTAGGKLDENLMSRSIDVVQAFAAMDDMKAEQRGVKNKFGSAAMFQVARLSMQMRSDESAVMGGIRGALGEVFYGGMNSFMYQVIGADRVRQNRMATGIMTGVAEVGAAALGLAATRILTKTKYGPKEETYKDYIQQAVAKIAEQAELYIQAAMAAQADPDIDIEDSEYEVNFDFNREVQPNEYQEKIQTGWIDFELDGDDGQPVDFDYAYA